MRMLGFVRLPWGHRSVRYADDCNVYVRVLEGLRTLYERLRLKVNDGKTAVAPATHRKFLGYAFWYGPGGQVRCKVAAKALGTFRQRIRQITRRSGGCSLSEIAERLRAYMPSWKAYFQLAQTPRVFRELDEWIRHRLRAVQLKHWRRGTTMYRELKAMGASEADARKVSANSRSWWRNNRMVLNRALPIAYFDRLGVPRLS
ncbi:Group II intron, maturase-specific domain [Azotobacter beijerinckii]|uniref:Group II intron, maturase-specific domain n=1 Tax=Azotobacter beijerinckii TaxID=170623 RepID=A0A1H6QWC4_9GAMM|nr:Group II intron, maturase-specific domain [Azotobacter beijerinckii]